MLRQTSNFIQKVIGNHWMGWNKIVTPSRSFCFKRPPGSSVRSMNCNILDRKLRADLEAYCDPSKVFWVLIKELAVGMKMRSENNLLLVLGWMCGAERGGSFWLGTMRSNILYPGIEYRSSRLWGAGGMSLFFSTLIQGLGVKFTWRDR